MGNCEKATQQYILQQQQSLPFLVFVNKLNFYFKPLFAVAVALRL